MPTIKPIDRLRVQNQYIREREMVGEHTYDLASGRQHGGGRGGGGNSAAPCSNASRSIDQGPLRSWEAIAVLCLIKCVLIVAGLE
eukprot:CAMPEP_0174347650 /NCGR_PEP_ID=MMETSP0811_2-20130205/3787_1 /TAXON_ID=73025 ORGANISM="Eutreptiella gymnastica-like, Strain CCMP1594" /NCGR_SAMPLE_ID=MMETSP0811_2 /ASSEMBLY_ACC=CAM_ASM_000667 /LENGTH=84 /DNA_ID=CAMNT_0015473395 /DNA_START=44 /DNA_END=298 /DNA_ORIENTATION=+